MLFPVEGSLSKPNGRTIQCGGSLVLELEESLLKATWGSMAGTGRGGGTRILEKSKQSPGKQPQMLKYQQKDEARTEIESK